MTETKHAEVKQEHRDWVHNAFPSYVIWPHSGVGAYGIHGLTGMCGDGFHTNECNVKARLLADHDAEVERKVLARVIKACDEEGYIHRSEVAELGPEFAE